MSTYGFPDGQELTQWLGQVLASAAAAPIGAGTINLGPFSLANFASIVVAIKPTGGAVTVKVKQKIANGPAALELDEQLVVTAGETVFQAFVLFGDSVSIELDGAVGGTTVDYAVYPSNTTTNAQVIQSATINVQHGGVLVGTEQTIDFEDAAGFAWTITDDGPNQRVKITPSGLALVKIADIVVGAAGVATIDIQGIPQTFKHLKLVLSLRGDAAATNDFLLAHLNADTSAVYDNMEGALEGNGSWPTFLDEYLATRAGLGLIPGATAGANQFAGTEVTFYDYTNENTAKTYDHHGWFLNGTRAALHGLWQGGGGDWNKQGAGTGINRITLVPNTSAHLVQYSRATLYGYGG